MKLPVPLLQCLAVFMFSPFSSSPSRLLFAVVDFAHFMLLHAPPDSPTKSKSQLPNAYSIFPQGIGPGDYEEKELEEGCGEMQLC